MLKRTSTHAQLGLKSRITTPIYTVIHKKVKHMQLILKEIKRRKEKSHNKAYLRTQTHHIIYTCDKNDKVLGN